MALDAGARGAIAMSASWSAIMSRRLSGASSIAWRMTMLATPRRASTAPSPPPMTPPRRDGAAARDRIVSRTRSVALTVAIVDYGSAICTRRRRRSSARRAAAPIRRTIVVTRDPDVVYRADRVVLPGVGAFADCRKGLDALDGMVRGAE